MAHATMVHDETHTWIYLAASPKLRFLTVSPLQMMIFRSYLTYPSHLNIVCRATGLRSSNLSTQWIQIMLKQMLQETNSERTIPGAPLQMTHWNCMLTLWYFNSATAPPFSKCNLSKGNAKICHTWMDFPGDSPRYRFVRGRWIIYKYYSPLQIPKHQAMWGWLAGHIGDIVPNNGYCNSCNFSNMQQGWRDGTTINYHTALVCLWIVAVLSTSVYRESTFQQLS